MRSDIGIQKCLEKDFVLLITITCANLLIHVKLCGRLFLKSKFRSIAKQKKNNVMLNIFFKEVLRPMQALSFSRPISKSLIFQKLEQLLLL